MDDVCGCEQAKVGAKRRGGYWLTTNKGSSEQESGSSDV